MVYAADHDPLCYPGTSVLKNKLGIRDQAKLDEFELALFLTRSEEPFPAGNLDSAHYRAIHRHLFQDVYAWAGMYRTIRIGKGGNWFCYPDYIEQEMDRVFLALGKARFFSTLGLADFRSSAAGLLAELNAIHPFRDGNGRTQLSFLLLLTQRCGHSFIAEALDPEAVMQAMIASFSGNIKALEQLMEKIVRS